MGEYTAKPWYLLTSMVLSLAAPLVSFPCCLLLSLRYSTVPFLVIPFHLYFGALWIFLFPFSLLHFLSPGSFGEDRQEAVMVAMSPQSNGEGRRQQGRTLMATRLLPYSSALSPVSFQVLLHVKSFLVLLLAFFSPPFPTLSCHTQCLSWCALARAVP